jgi:antitoxin CptB
MWARVAATASPFASPRAVRPISRWRAVRFARYSNPMAALTDLQIRRKQALFRAQRRGFKELDLVFGAFADAHLENLSEDELARFEALLSIPDWQMSDWIMGHEKVPSTHDHAVFARLRAYRSNLPA